MTQTVTLKSFAELGHALGIDPTPEEAARQVAEEAGEDSHPLPDLAGLLTELESASGTLAAIARRDQEHRVLALQDLERYGRLRAEQRGAEEARARAKQVRREAEALSERAFAEEARREAERIVGLAVQAEVDALDAANRWQSKADRLASELNLERLLEERRRDEEAQKAKAAEAERARRLTGALARARAALEAGRFEEAGGLLGQLAKDNPDNPEVASLKTIIAQRLLSVKIATAEEALWETRRVYRHDSPAAVALLEGLDIDGLPEPLGRQVFGEWARACSRFCRERGITDPLRYAPEPGRGAIIASEGNDGTYVVMSSLGMGTSWQKGTAVGERQVRRARPLR